jgi:uncharacterized protein YcfJ
MARRKRSQPSPESDDGKEVIKKIGATQGGLIGGAVGTAAGAAASAAVAATGGLSASASIPFLGVSVSAGLAALPTAVLMLAKARSSQLVH